MLPAACDLRGGPGSDSMRKGVGPPAVFFVKTYIITLSNPARPHRFDRKHPATVHSVHPGIPA